MFVGNIGWARLVRMTLVKRNALALAVIMACAGTQTQAASALLGNAQSFSVLGHTTVSNTGSSVITGNVGVFDSAGSTASTGFSSSNTFAGPGSNTNGPGIVNAPSVIHLGDTAAGLARTDVITAYNALAGLPFPTILTGQNLGGLTLVPGVYFFATSAQLTGTLTLNAQGNNNAFWVFQIGSTLTTASSSVVQLINPGTNNGFDDGVFWQVGSSATLGTSTIFEGNILALTSITLNTSARIDNGRALVQNGAVTLDTNIISNVCPPPNNGPGFSGGLGFENGKVVSLGTQALTVPLPSAFLLGGCGLVCLFVSRLRPRTAT